MGTLGTEIAAVIPIAFEPYSGRELDESYFLKGFFGNIIFSAYPVVNTSHIGCLFCKL